MALQANKTSSLDHLTRAIRIGVVHGTRGGDLRRAIPDEKTFAG
jgi:hypothetical protein